MKTQKSNWITLKEAIEYSGLGDSTIRNAIYNGTLKASRHTGKLLFQKRWIDKWLMFGKQRLSSIEQAEFKTELQDG
jgi:excisionase family DNA binding protein